MAAMGVLETFLAVALALFLLERKLNYELISTSESSVPECSREKMIAINATTAIATK